MQKNKASDSTSLLSRNVNIDGEIRGEENLHIDGRINGAVKINGDILIGSSGVVEAEIEANNVVIQGQVTGNVLARQQLEIQSSGRLFGDCSARSIDIKEGAMFEGRSKMLRSSGVSGGSGVSVSAVAKEPAKANLK